MTIEEIAREILRLTGSSSKLVYRPLPEDDPKVRQPDITRRGRCSAGNRRSDWKRA